jgi:hypothetical protein
MWNSVQKLEIKSSVRQDISTFKPALRKRSRRSIADLLRSVNLIAAESTQFVGQAPIEFELQGETYEIPRYLFLGPKGGDTPLRIGIFAGVHGDEPEGVYALVEFLKILESNPELAAGYALSVYPLCNPTGFEDNSRNSRRGKDLNREFWKNSDEPEVRLLQADLSSRSFHGIISLHTDDTATGFYGVARGATLTKHLVEPALQAADKLLLRDERPIIDGFPARNGIIPNAYDGMLSGPPKVRPRPFEIILETPKAPSAYLKQAAFIAALQAILAEYRKFIAYAQNL